MKILLCEDQDSIRSMIETLMRASGHHVTAVSTGIRALDLAVVERFDVVLLDLALPGVDGLEVCRRIRQNEATRTIPVVIITASDDTATRAAAAAAGASAFYGKPFSPVALLRELSALAGPTRRATPR